MTLVSGDIFLSTLSKCFFASSLSAFLFPTLTLDTGKLHRTLYVTCILLRADLKQPAWLCYLINKASSWFVLRDFLQRVQRIKPSFIPHFTSSWYFVLQNQVEYFHLFKSYTLIRRSLLFLLLMPTHLSVCVCF